MLWYPSISRLSASFAISLMVIGQPAFWTILLLALYTAEYIKSSVYGKQRTRHKAGEFRAQEIQKCTQTLLRVPAPFHRRIGNHIPTPLRGHTILIVHHMASRIVAMSFCEPRS